MVAPAGGRAAFVKLRRPQNSPPRLSYFYSVSGAPDAVGKIGERSLELYALCEVEFCGLSVAVDAFHFVVEPGGGFVKIVTCEIPPCDGVEDVVHLLVHGYSLGLCCCCHNAVFCFGKPRPLGRGLLVSR